MVVSSSIQYSLVSLLLQADLLEISGPLVVSMCYESW